MTVADLLGPGAALALALLMLALFYTGRILPRNAVPREDYDALRAVNAAYADKFGALLDGVRVLSAAIDRLAKIVNP